MKNALRPLDRVDDANRSDFVYFAVPWPPSTNRVWRVGKSTSKNWTKPRVYRSEPYEKFLQRVFADAFDGRIPAIKKRDAYSVEIRLYPKDAKRYDADNRAKAVLDALTKIGMWDDDSQVRELLIVKQGRREFQKKTGAFAYVQIRGILDEPSEPAKEEFLTEALRKMKGRNES